MSPSYTLRALNSSQVVAKRYYGDESEYTHYRQSGQSSAVFVDSIIQAEERRYADFLEIVAAIEARGILERHLKAP